VRLKYNIDKEIIVSEDILSSIIEYHNEVTKTLLESERTEALKDMTPLKYISAMMFISLHLCSVFVGDKNKEELKVFVNGIVDAYLETKVMYEQMVKAGKTSKFFN